MFILNPPKCYYCIHFHINLLYMHTISQQFIVCQPPNNILLYNKYIMIAFSTRLKALREEKHLSQKEIANLVGSQQQVVSKWELGVSEPDFKSLALLCDFFEVSADYLLGLDDLFSTNHTTKSCELTPLQQELLAMFTKLSPQNQYKALGVILGISSC